MSLEVNNQSKRVIKTVSIDLQRDSLYYAQGRSNVEVDFFGMTNLPPVASKAIHQAQVPFQVPAVCPSIMCPMGGCCRIIQIKYFLRMKIKAGGFTRSKYLYIPIVVGMVSLQSTQTTSSVSQVNVEALQIDLNTPVHSFQDNLAAANSLTNINF
jgi:hypothetical protein